MDIPSKNQPAQDQLAGQAREAAQKVWNGFRKTPDRNVFVFALPSVDWTTDKQGPTWADWNKAIAAIEDVGWRLDKWEVVHTGGNTFTAFPTFRRPTRA